MKKLFLILFLLFIVSGFIFNSGVVFADYDNGDNGDSEKDSEGGDNSGSNKGTGGDKDLGGSDSESEDDDFDEDNEEDLTEDDKEDESGPSIKDEIKTEEKIENGKKIIKKEIRKRSVDEEGKVFEVKIKIEEETKDGEIETKIKIERGKEKEFEIESEIKLETKIDKNNKAKLNAHLSDDSIIEGLFLPNDALDIANTLIESENITGKLFESLEEKRVIYEFESNKKGRFLGLFKVKIKVKTKIDAENGSVISFEKPFLSSLVSGEDAKVVICHIPRGNPDEKHTIVVGAPAVVAHMKHGDHLGACDGEEPPGNETNETNQTVSPQWFDNLTNSTLLGETVNHSVRWTDDVALANYTFSFDNGTGNFVNDSPVVFTGTQNFSNVIKSVNTTSGTTIRWRVYANDSSNNFNVTDIFSYTTTN